MTGVERPVDEIANLVTHGIGLLLSIPTAVYLMQSVASRSFSLIAACGIYVASLILAYVSSTLSHLFYDLQWRKRFRTLDQVSIFLLIAGTCTPLGVMYLNHGGWQWLLVSIWVLASIGIGRVVHVRNLSRTDKSLYGLMGFLPVVGLGEMSRQAPEDVIFWVIAGGACYTLGTLFLCWSARVRYSHAVWHLLVVSGSACHYWAILLTVFDR